MKPSQSPKAQQGFIAILLLVTIAIAAVAVFSKNIWGGDSKALQQQQTQAALQQAKAALLAYVETGTTGDLSATNLLLKVNGRLPCPNQSGDGTALGTCGAAGVHQIGLFPWATLGQPALRDSANECLWYAVDGLFKINSPTGGLNADANGSFSIIKPIKATDPTTKVESWSETVLAGNTSTAIASDPNRVVAVIIAPGSASNGQTRTSAINTACPTPSGVASSDVKQYLENYVPSVTTGLSAYNQMNPAGLMPHTLPAPNPNNQLNTFAQADSTQEKLNDQIIWITATEFANAATKRTARILASYINTYVTNNAKYPSAASDVVISTTSSTPPATGACVQPTKSNPSLPYQLQGFMPYSCSGTTGAGDMTLNKPTSTSGDRLYGDPDWWYGHTHYAVSETCVKGGTPAVYYPDGSLKTPAYPCNGVATINLGTGAPVSAILIVRGRAIGTQSCAYSGLGGMPDVSACIDNTTNKNTISAALTAPLTTANKTISMATKIYEIPSNKNLATGVAVSNDYMVQFTTK
jgi:hypothetical protein